MAPLMFVFLVFCVVVAAQIIDYFAFLGKFAFSVPKSGKEELQGVSVLVYTKKDIEALERNLPYLFKQDYPAFEVILIADFCDDEMIYAISDIKEKYKNLKVINVFENEYFFGNKRYALTLGIKASKYDKLVFTTNHCRPSSDLWLRELASKFSEGKQVVIGYAGYTRKKSSFFNALVRFDRLLSAMKFLSFAKMGKPYMAVDDNMAYTKELFLKSGGYRNCMLVEGSHDKLYINQISNRANTDIVFTKDSLVENTRSISFFEWLRRKKIEGYNLRKSKLINRIVLYGFSRIQTIFWILAAILLISQYRFCYVLWLFLARIVAGYITFFVSAKKLSEKGLVLAYPIFELVLIFANNVMSLLIWYKPVLKNNVSRSE